MAAYWHRILAAVFAIAAIEFSGIPSTHAQEPRPDYLRPGFGSRGIGTADWVFVPYMQTVFQRPRRDYDPLGIRLGNFDLSTQLGIGGGYVDNIFTTDTNTKDDFIGSLTPGFRLRSDWPVHLFGIEASGEFDQYASESSQNSNSGQATVFGRLDITGDDSLFGSASVRREVEHNGDEESRSSGITEFDRAVERLGYTHQFARVNVRLTGQHQRLAFLRNVDDDRDRNEVNIGGRITYALSPRLTPFVQSNYRITDFDERATGTGLDRDSTEYSVSIGSRVLITEILQAELAVGVSHVDFADSTLKSDTSPSVSGQLIWNVTPLTSIIMDAFRDQSASTQGGTAGRIDTGATLRIEQELSDNLLIFGSAGYRNEDFQDTSRTDDRIRAAIGGEFLLNRNVSFSAQYQFQDRMSSASGLDFIENSVFFQTRLRY
jgi:hypothetical protein